MGKVIRLSDHFTLDELVRSETATRHGIDNTPGPPELINLTYTALFHEQIRAALAGHSIYPSSGYRCPELNALVRGSPTSAHMEGRAMDWTCPGFGSPEVIFQELKQSGIQFDKLILEFGQWIHTQIRPLNRGNRGIVLMAVRGADGRTIYEKAA